MDLRKLKNTNERYWTEHAKFKMKFYGLSPQRVLRVIRNPERTEEGIVPKTTAVMQPSSVKRDKNGKLKWSSEIWAMYQSRRGVTSLKPKVQSLKPNIKDTLPFAKYKIISAWRYPGVSPKNNPVPEEILREIAEFD